MTWTFFINSVVMAYRTLSSVPRSFGCLKKHARVSWPATTLRLHMPLIIPFLRLYLNWFLLLPFVGLSSPWHLRFSGLNFSWCAWVALLAVFLSVMPSGVDGFDERSGVDDWREPSFLLYIYLYILVYIYIYIFLYYIYYIYIYIYIHSSMMKLFWENSYRLSPEAAALTCFWK